MAIIKHANPCGIAVGADVAEAHRKAHACDPVSAYGGVIAVNRPVTVEMAEQVAEIFTEVLVAPAFEDGAVEVLQREEEHPAAGQPAWRHRDAVEFRQISGGMLMQIADRIERRRRRPGDLDAGRRRAGRRGRPWRTSRSPGGPAGR